MPYPPGGQRGTRSELEVAVPYKDQKAARFQMAVRPAVGGQEGADHMTGAGRLKDSDEYQVMAIRG
jgi:hypothetical protein